MGAAVAEAAPAIAGATKTKYKGGWLDKDLRRANGRVGLSTAERPAPPSPVWNPRPSPDIDRQGWMQTRDGDSTFQVCVGCHRWTGAANIVRRDGVVNQVVYSRSACRCPETEARSA